MSKNKYYLLLLLLLCGSVRLLSQNLPYYDNRLFHFGFSIGANMMHFDATPSMASIDNTSYQVRVSTLVPGFSVGAVTDLRLSKHLNLRCTPTLHFGQRTLFYKSINASDDAPADFSQEVVSLPISIPLYLKFSANRVSNYRPYIIGGGGVYFDLGRDKEKAVLLQPFDYFVEFGFGCDLYFSFFKLAPELKFAIGFNDMITPMAERPNFIIEDDKKYTQAIRKLTSQMLTLTFNFE